MSLWGPDTSSDVERLVTELTRAQTAEQKILQVLALNRMTRELALAGIRRRHPKASDEEMRKRLAALLLDRDMVVRLLGWDPAKEGY